MDLGGIGIFGASKVYGYVQEASKIGQNYYPERMGIMTVIWRMLTGREVLPDQCTLGVLHRVVCYKALA